jgi:hypothetical protein
MPMLIKSDLTNEDEARSRTSGEPCHDDPDPTSGGVSQDGRNCTCERDTMVDGRARDCRAKRL